MRKGVRLTITLVEVVENDMSISITLVEVSQKYDFKYNRMAEKENM